MRSDDHRSILSVIQGLKGVKSLLGGRSLLLDADMTETRTEWSLGIMERHIAKVTAISASASLIAGTFAFGAVGGLSVLGFGATKSVHQTLAGPALQQDMSMVTDATGTSAATRNVPILVNVVQPSTSSTSRAGTSIAAAQASGIVATNQPATLAAQPDATGTGPTNAPSVVQPVTTLAPTTSPAKTTPPTLATTPPSPAATVPSATTPTTTRPPGVPADWPAGKPIPKMPPNCAQPQLELSGVWNCND